MNKQNKSSFTIIILISYFGLVTYWMTFGFGRQRNADFMYNLIPFNTIMQYLYFENYNLTTWIINLIGNIGVFVPFGVLLPLVFRSRLLKIVVIFETGLMVLELTQLVTKRGSFDIDDFILNTFGLLLGYGLYKQIIKLTLWK